MILVAGGGGEMGVVLGINGLPAWHARHDPGAALVVDGQVVTAVEEERLSRVKRAHGLPPSSAAREVLALAGLRPADVDLVAYPWLPRSVDAREDEVSGWLRSMLEASGLPVRAPVRFVEHHLAHAWSVMPFLERRRRDGRLGARGDRVVALVLDASGETTSGAAFRLHRETGMEKLWNLSQRSSLGAYYEAVTQVLGFGPGEEGKTMGLACYGRPRQLSLPQLTDDRFVGDLPTRRDDPELHAGSFAELRRSLASEIARRNPTLDAFEARADLARAGEEVVARSVLRYVEELLGDADVLTLSGGLALNCTINARVAALCAERGVTLMVPPPASDTGVALGAAVAASQPGCPTGPARAYLGRGYMPQTLMHTLRDAGLAVQPSDAGSLAEELVERSAVCGWIEGRSEIGPRALGARAILARADSVATRDRINRLKHREAWRPLAPAMTPAEFERSCPGQQSDEHMLVAAVIDPEARHRLAGVTHVDGSTRAQVVHAAGPYRDVLDAAGALTGTYALTCTSFNRAGEPMVYTPQDAVASAASMGLDLLAGAGWYVSLAH